jgi:probable rRNA maturation factor
MGHCRAPNTPVPTLSLKGRENNASLHAGNPKLSLAVQYATDDRRVPSRSQLRRWILAALDRDANVTLRIVDAKESRELNRAYRKKDYPTNVLTFVYGETAGGTLSGDIVLCAPVVVKEARAQRKELEQHYAHLMIHGALHLQGYDHETPADAEVMELREVTMLARMKIANPYGT